MSDLVRRHSDAISLPSNAHPTSTGLLMAAISRKDHEHIGCFLASVASASQWWIGDWVLAAKPAYGDLADLCEAAGLNYQTARNCASVCHRFEMSRRRDNLSFAHHEAVAVNTLEDEEQDDLLDEAKSQNWTRDQLRKSVRKKLQLSDGPVDNDPALLGGPAGVSTPDDSDGSVLVAADNGTSPPADEPEPAVLDAEDRPVPEQLVGIFADRTYFSSILHGLSTMKTDITKLQARPSGVLLAEYAQGIEVRRKELYNYIKFAQPHATCPYCDADKKTCDACHGAGWVNKVVYSQAPPRSTAAGNGGSDDSEIPF